MLAYLAACGMGLGHASRMLAVARRLNDAGVKVVFSSYDKAADMIERSGYPCLRTRSVSYEVDEEGDVDVRRTLAKGPLNLYHFARQLGDELYFTGTLEPQIVISDSRLSTLLAAKIQGMPALLVLSQLKVIIPIKHPSKEKLETKGLVEEGLYKLLGRFWLLADEIEVPDFPPPYTVAKANLLDEPPPPRTRFVGPSLPVWPDEMPSRDEVREELGVKGKMVLASFTGVGKEGKVLADVFLEELSKRNLPDDVSIIVSRGSPTGSSRLEEISKGVLVCDWLQERYLYMRAADALVSHGGHTSVMEAMVFGLPALHLVRRTHTERLGNSRSAESLGVAKTYLVGGDNEDLVSLLKWVLSDEAWSAAQKLSRELIHFKGDEEIASRALKLAKAGVAL
ncbi:MAG: hypothetical protein NZ954_03755 [Thermofilaceae archaeon]|nr:hypothetical protein [Thermofilaceae archaeon]MCX8181313.1 hypothetical protein [Thermofilaceae archaeon]MDW8004656.1 glycosyltransferase [Thermofilaceae archaeon]